MSEPTKSLEIELKLILPGSQAENLIIECLKQNGYVVEKIGALKNIDIYMDTSDWMLLKNKLSLRYRLSNEKAIYTMKSVETIEDGIAKRMETEVALEKPSNTPTEIPVKSLQTLVNELIFPRKLLEQILIRTLRRRYLAGSPEGAKFELSFDNSTFSSDALFRPRRAERLFQFEAEVLEGPPGAVEALASLLSGSFGYIPATTSKLEYAMSRLKVEPIIKKVPEDLKVKLDDRLDAALKKILEVEFQWLREQFPGTIADRDPEFVHQARVTTRRMRSALILFHNALPEKTVLYFEERLKWIGGLFGKVRDLDVFIINLTVYKEKIEDFPKEKRKELESLIVKQRRAPLKALNDALNSRKYKIFERRLVEFLEEPCADCPEMPMGMKPIREVAPPTITGKFDNVIEQSKKTLGNPKLTEFHCLRIQMKRLRYVMEFMATPYGGALNNIILQTTEIQDCLGQLQDTVFNQKLIKQILSDWEGKLVDSDLIFILGEIYQYQGDIAIECKKTFSEKWRNFSSEHSRILLTRVFAKTHSETIGEPHK